MKNATLTLTILSATFAEKQVIGTASFTYGEKSCPISFVGNSEYLQDIAVVGNTILALGDVRAIKDGNSTNLNIYITSAFVLSTAPTVVAIDNQATGKKTKKIAA